MDTLLDEQELTIRNTARGFLQARATPALAREMEGDRLGYRPALWRELAGLDWLGLCLPEGFGGQGLPLQYAGLLLEEVGRHLAPVPLHSTLSAALTIARHGGEGMRQAVLPRVCSGDLILTFAAQEGSRYFDPPLGTSARRDGQEFVLHGTKTFVDNVAAAGQCLVSCRAVDAEGAVVGDGVALFLVPTDAPGVIDVPLVTLAKDRQSTVHLDRVRVPRSALLGSFGHGAPALADLRDHAAALLCAQMVGAARRDGELAVEHAKNREAFGRRIAAFQSIQHLCADMLIHVDGAELLTREALWLMGAGRPGSVEVSQAKAFASEKCVGVVRSSQQIHGGIGFMMEFDLHLWYRRVVAWSVRAGTVSEHRARVAGALLDRPGPVRLGMAQHLAQ